MAPNMQAHVYGSPNPVCADIADVAVADDTESAVANDRGCAESSLVLLTGVVKFGCLVIAPLVR
jgi:hypothetical protein